MIKRYLLPLSLASLVIPIASAIAIAGPQLANLNPASAIAQFPPCPPPPPPMGMESGSIPEPPWAKNLNLSTEQRERIQAVHQQGIKAMQQLQLQLFEADYQMRSLLESSAPKEQLRQQHQYIQTLRQQLDSNHFEMMLAERQLLTPEQLTELKRLMQQQWGRPW